MKGTSVDQETMALELPGDVLKIPGTPYRAAQAELALTPELATALAAKAASGLLRPLMLAAWSILLHRYTQQTELPFTLVVNGQSPEGGLRQVVMSLESQHSAARIIEAAARLLCSHTKLLPAQTSEAAFTFVATDTSAAQAVEQAIEIEADLHLLCFDSQQGASVRVIYNRSLFHPETIERLLGHISRIITGVLRCPEQAVKDLPLLTDGEIERLLVTWQSPKAAYSKIPIHHYVEAHARERPDAIAVSFRDQSLSYAELDARANRLAHYLIEKGVSANVRVAVCVEPSLDITVCLLGIFKAGGVHVPLDPSYPNDRLAVILEETSPSVVLTQTALLPKLTGSSAPILCFDRDAALLLNYSTGHPGIACTLEQTAYIVYTSGTTGKPKGVMASHANLVNYVLVARDAYGFNARDVFVAMARFSFSITMFELLSPLVAGGRLIVLERDHVLDFKRLVPTLQTATVVHTSPSLLRRLVAYARDNAIPSESFRSLRHVSSGGDLVAADLLESLKSVFDKAELFVIYGSSEIACMGCTFPVPRDRTVTKSYVGKPFPNVSVRLYDPHQNLVPIGVAGEIYFGGAGLAQGYLDRDDLTREKFIDIDGERFYRMGDMGRFDAEGQLEILGRNDFQIKLRGMRIELLEIEATLRSAPFVREGVVAAKQIGDEEKTLVAYIVFEPSQACDVKGLRKFLASKLPDYMVPQIFVILPALPVNMNQKVDRKALPMPTQQDMANLRSFVPPRTEPERKLAQIWERLLKSSDVGIQDNFFEIGGDSLMALPMVMEIEKAFGCSLQMSALLTDPTIEQLARSLDESSTATRESVVLLRDGGSEPPMFFVHDGEGESLPYRTLAQQLSPSRRVYGLHPLSRAGYPMLHSRLSDVVDYYTMQIKRVQPKGPYFLGGLCIGGFMAFEIARRLKAMEEEVALVALIDAAHVKTPAKSLHVAQFNRFKKSVVGGGTQNGLLKRIHSGAKIAARKIVNVTRYELTSRWTRARNRFKMRALRLYLDLNFRLPTWLRNIPVRIVLRFAEREYVIPDTYAGEVVLFRATKADSIFQGTIVDDTPYIELFKDPMLGWDQRIARSVRVHDIPGGHSSMLQEPNVKVLARLIQRYIDNFHAGNSTGDSASAVSLIRASGEKTRAAG